MCVCGGVRTRNVCVWGGRTRNVCVWGVRTRNMCVCVGVGGGEQEMCVCVWGGVENKKCVCVCGGGGRTRNVCVCGGALPAIAIARILDSLYTGSPFSVLYHNRYHNRSIR